MIPYILHVALLITVCLLFYKLLLQKETFYRLNRIILVFCLALSFILPLIPIPQQWALRAPAKPTEVQDQPIVVSPAVANVPQINPVTNPGKTKQASATATPVTPAKPAPASAIQHTAQTTEPSVPVIQTVFKWLFYLYWIGVAAFGLNLLLQVVVLLFQAYTKPAIRDGKFRIVELTGDKAPCSFGNHIFINPEKYDWETYSQILLHEKVHIEQRHSFDILVAELMLVLQWFNPFAWLYRTEVENNLEFLTDDAVLGHEEVERSSYQMSLLKVSAPHLSLGITTNYNQSLLKRRIIMMNAKRSNIHIMWKYFFLVPLLGILACALNSPAAYSASATNSTANIKALIKVNPVVKPTFNFNFKEDQTEGLWFANIKNDKVRMEFKSDDDEHNWSSNADFKLSEFSAIPRDKKAEFTIKREPGTILFNGKFDGNDGYGHYKFTADHQFNTFLGERGITGIEDGDDFAFFMFNINKEYVAMLENNGYKGLSKSDLISMGALKVDEAYIHFWKESGYTHLTANELVAGKALGITSEYVNEIRKAGYTHVTFEQLQSFKATGVTAKYIAGLHGANVKPGKKHDNGHNNGDDHNDHDPMSAEDVVSVKAMNVASTYINAIQKAGYPDITLNELTSMKAVGITPQYIDELKLAGYINVPVHQLISLKSVGVTPEYVKSMAAIGYKNIPANELTNMKAVGVTAEFVAGFKNSRYTNIPANGLVSLKSVGATPEFAKGFANLGYKNIPAHQLVSLKAVGVTPEYVQSLKAAGYDNIPVNDLVSMRSQGISPDFAKSYESVGYKNISIHQLVTLKAMGISPEYIKNFQDAGYKDVSINEYSGLKALGVTPDFIESFKKIGYPNISLNEATSLKATGVTPDYVAKMREKGFKSQDLNKYIQLKNNFGDDNNK
ncbi:M56 family metallopeptidase [Mucilaginibacter sp.]|uniref:M56 family metallopeptidase n=1 Tax=Mucilaginibacter sp. TaxID=1882438 RepID=UPI00284A8DEB|nr:M56 family metallopeptidase [Mucilaginibacter sp.]MDR3697276.1 M56 family metallopeptidase [Mucilaginibacter sp.]